jgi:hypothetical protein
MVPGLKIARFLLKRKVRSYLLDSYPFQNLRYDPGLHLETVQVRFEEDTKDPFLLFYSSSQSSVFGMGERGIMVRLVKSEIIEEVAEMVQAAMALKVKIPLYEDKAACINLEFPPKPTKQEIEHKKMSWEDY